MFRPSGGTNIVENASNAAMHGAAVVGTKRGLAAVGSATVAVLSESSGIERPFCFGMRRGLSRQIWSRPHKWSPWTKYF